MNSTQSTACNLLRLARLAAAAAMLFLLFSGAPLQAGIATYQFTYTPYGGDIEPFQFSLNSGHWLQHELASVTPFTITNGTHTWQITRAVAGDDCFVFGSDNLPNLTLYLYWGCGSGTSGSYPPDLYFATVDGHFASGTMPTAPGTYTLPWSMARGAFNDVSDISYGDMELVITVHGVDGDIVVTPEASTYLLAATGLSGLFWLRARRRRRE